MTLAIMQWGASPDQVPAMFPAEKGQFDSPLMLKPTCLNLVTDSMFFAP